MTALLLGSLNNKATSCHWTKQLTTTPVPVGLVTVFLLLGAGAVVILDGKRMWVEFICADANRQLPTGNAKVSRLCHL